jgi:cytochrome c biogenesis protein CcmG/thiol:disulfide interchange protein DsbE
MIKRAKLVPAILVVGGLALFAALADWEPRQADVLVGYWHDADLQQAPDFTLPAMEGDSLTLSDYRGRIVVLNVWATWCAPCRKEMPDFVQLQDEFRPYAVQFIGVSIDSGGWEVVRPFGAEFNVNYPLLLDDGTVYGTYEGSTGVPTTYLINRDGQIWRYMPGALTRETLARALSYMIESARR